MDAALLRVRSTALFDLGAKGDWGLALDGVMATPELLAEAGPEELFREAVSVVRAQTGLSPSERKN